MTHGYTLHLLPMSSTKPALKITTLYKNLCREYLATVPSVQTKTAAGQKGRKRRRRGEACLSYCSHCFSLRVCNPSQGGRLEAGAQGGCSCSICSWCGVLNGNVCHWLICSNVWSLVSRTVWEGLGDVVLLREECY